MSKLSIWDSNHRVSCNWTCHAHSSSLKFHTKLDKGLRKVLYLWKTCINQVNHDLLMCEHETCPEISGNLKDISNTFHGNDSILTLKTLPWHFICQGCHPMLAGPCKVCFSLRITRDLCWTRIGIFVEQTTVSSGWQKIQVQSMQLQCSCNAVATALTLHMPNQYATLSDHLLQTISPTVDMEHEEIRIRTSNKTCSHVGCVWCIWCWEVWEVSQNCNVQRPVPFSTLQLATQKR